MKPQTPTPWTTSGLKNLIHIECDHTREHICSMSKANEKDADLIIEAVNSHHAFKAALTEIVNAWLQFSDDPTILDKAIKNAKQLL